MNNLIEDIIKPENNLESAIIIDPDFIEGANWGKSRKGHPEGKVIYHIKEVLKNIDEYYYDDIDRNKLRIIAILHDTFKHKVNLDIPKTGENHHGMIARRYAEKFKGHLQVSDSIKLVLELHDEAYNAWSKGNRHGDWKKSDKRGLELINKLISEECLELFTKFYDCDNATGNKSSDDYDWFMDLVDENVY
jgi:hypothetical protein